MTHLTLRHLLIWLVICSCSTAYSQIYLMNAPQFAQTDQTVTISAYLDDAAKQVKLNWTSDTQDRQTDMSKDPRPGCWTATIPAQAIQGTELSYSVTAEYDQSPAETSDVYTLYICPSYTVLQPEPMVLKQTIVAEKKWNSDDDAFGLLQPKSGPPVGPASIAYRKGEIYLLDRVNKRVVRFNKASKTRAAMAIPSSNVSDLVLDPKEDSVLVVSQFDDKIYHFRKGRLSKTQSAQLKDNFAYPAKFSFDSTSKSLLAQKQSRQKSVDVVTRQQRMSKKQMTQAAPQASEVYTEVRRNALLVKADNSDQIFAVTFNRPVAYIDEAAIDANGIAWILYTMQGDYRIRRLARVDTVNNTAEVTAVNVWFSFDATRRMTLTDNGVALMAGDIEHGRVITFDYTGGVK